MPSSESKPVYLPVVHLLGRNRSLSQAVSLRTEDYTVKEQLQAQPRP